MRSRDKKTISQKAGFTLLEMVLVLALIGLMAALVGPRLFGALDRGQRQTAIGQMALLGSALDLYRLDTGRLPSTQEGLAALLSSPTGTQNWRGPYLRADHLPKDPWGNLYLYRLAPESAAGYRIKSLGADGAEGGEGNAEDIENP